MKKSVLTAVLVIMVILLGVTSHAALITDPSGLAIGSISVPPTLTGGTTLANNTGFSFTVNSSGVNGYMNASSGYFTPYLGTGVIFHDFNFVSVVSGSTLWNIPNTNPPIYFTMSDVGYLSRNGTLSLSISGNGFFNVGTDQTPGTWTFVANETNSSLSFASTAGTDPVPEPGTIMLLGSGLVGLAIWGRKRFRK